MDYLKHSKFRVIAIVTGILAIFQVILWISFQEMSLKDLCNPVKNHLGTAGFLFILTACEFVLLKKDVAQNMKVMFLILLIVATAYGYYLLYCCIVMIFSINPY